MHQRREYVRDYNRRNYDRLSLIIPKGQRLLIDRAAANAGESLNAYLIRSLLDKLGLDAWPELGEADQSDATERAFAQN
ncbi:MAG: hypothetical protein LBS11_07100 [Oscillospiraceae bacterium]|jgi:hypothetical protein|nr:hypothetical protein [Oscillospiraceae bacterium]